LKIVSFTCSDTRERTGALLADDELVLDLTSQAAGLPVLARPLDAFDMEAPFLGAARALWTRTSAPAERTRLQEAGAVVALDRVSLLAPVPRPGKILCIGRNYREHAAESQAPLPERPLLFSKFPSSVSAPGATIRIPRGSTQLDYEAELGVVIGRRAARVPAARALEHVLGYVNFNDVTARDFQRRDGQWQRGKSCDGFAPFGPFLVTADEIPDPQRLRIRLRLGGRTMQEDTTANMIFPVAQLIEALSEHVTLEPGDVIATGTPAGVGFARNPPVWMQPGDVVEVEIEGLGVLTNVVAASA